MMLKQAAKLIVPSPLWQKLCEWKHGEKTYRTWGGAVAAAGAYDSDVLNRFRVARAKQDVRLPLSPAMYCALTNLALPPEVQITDFGGGCGQLAKSFRLGWPATRWTVVEHPGLVRLLEPVKGITFTTHTPSACDIFYTGGTLQYLARPYRVLEAGFKSARLALVMERNSFSERRLVRVQHGRLYDNGSGPVPVGYLDREITYPHQTIKESRVRAIAARYGFGLFLRQDETSGVLPFRDLVYGKRLVFIRR